MASVHMVKTNRWRTMARLLAFVVITSLIFFVCFLLVVFIYANYGSHGPPSKELGEGRGSGVVPDTALYAVAVSFLAALVSALGTASTIILAAATRTPSR